MDQWGDYLIYRLYPSKQVFIDGRSDFYGDKSGERYLDLTYVKYGWEKTLDQYEIDTILLSSGYAPLQPHSRSRAIGAWCVRTTGSPSVFRRAATGPVAHARFLSLCNERSIRDRAITKMITRDRKVTQPTT